MTNCRNCSITIPKEASFCASCGAKMVTERITLKRILSEVAETIFGWDNKYFFTLRSLFLKPNMVLEEYVSGIRKRYVHPFTFLIIGATLALFSFTFFLDNYMADIQEFNKQLVERYSDVGIRDLGLEQVDDVQSQILKYFNIVTLLLIPLYSLFTFILYRKKFNYAEHLVFNAYVQGAIFVVAIVFFYLSLLTHPLVYSFALLGTWAFHAYAFGKLFKLDAGMSILKLVLFHIMFIIFAILLITLIVLISILFAYLRN